MEILITGYTALLQGVHLEDHFPDCNIVITDSKSSLRRIRNKRITYVDIDKDKSGEVFDIHDFSEVIFISGLLNPLFSSASEYESIFRVLFNSRRCSVPRVLICVPDEKFEKEETQRADEFFTIKAMTDYFSSNSALFIKYLHVPYVVNKYDKGNFAIEIQRLRARQLCHGKRQQKSDL